MADANRKKFLLTRLMRGVTRKYDMWFAHWAFLLTRLMRGVTRSYYSYVVCDELFLLARLMRGVTHQGGAGVCSPNDFYSHASCEA